MTAYDFSRHLGQIKVVNVWKGFESLEWMNGLSFFWPRTVVHDLISSKGEPLLDVKYDNKLYSLRIPSEQNVKADFPLEAMDELFFSSKPASARFPFSYQKVPHKIRWLIAAAVVKFNRSRAKKGFAFPQWPLDLSTDALADVYNCCSDEKVIASHENIVLLTHDIDTPESLDNLPSFLKIEESFGIKSTSFVVPKGWNITHRILENAAVKGHELGIHGYNHDNRTPFLSENEIEYRMNEVCNLISLYKMKGYRSPSLLRSKPLFQALEKYFLYDSSIPNAGGYYARRGNGCASARPFYYGNLFEIPLTLPSDANLLFQGFNPGQILKLWKNLSETIIRSGGIVHLLTHCEKRYSGNKIMLETYKEYISYIQSFFKPQWKTLSDLVVRKTGDIPLANSST